MIHTGTGTLDALARAYSPPRISTRPITIVRSRSILSSIHETDDDAFAPACCSSPPFIVCPFRVPCATLSQKDPLPLLDPLNSGSCGSGGRDGNPNVVELSVTGLSRFASVHGERMPGVLEQRRNAARNLARACRCSGGLGRGLYRQSLQGMNYDAVRGVCTRPNMKRRGDMARGRESNIRGAASRRSPRLCNTCVTSALRH